MTRVLIVEDEVLIGLVLEDILDMLGCQVAGNAASFDEAEALVVSLDGAFDVAILDVNLGATPVFPIADKIVALGKTVVFATGSHPDTLPSRFQACGVLEKPYAYAAVEAVLARQKAAA